MKYAARPNLGHLRPERPAGSAGDLFALFAGALTLGALLAAVIR
jgi:hypothetical protein